MDPLIATIKDAFSDLEYPGDSNLRNSDEGNEPYLLEDEFKGKRRWQDLSAEFLNQAPAGFGSALSFFSPAAFQFYLPAYMLADIAGNLRTTDVVFFLTHGLTDETKNARINPVRYGELTWYNYVADRFSRFNRRQIKAIISFLNYKKGGTTTDYERAAIEQALANYWLSAEDS